MLPPFYSESCVFLGLLMVLIYSDKHLYYPPNWHMFDTSLTENESSLTELKLASMQLFVWDIKSVLL